jgi:hypothetical protein
MGIALLDSNTVIGFLDADDRLHQAADAAVRADAPHASAYSSLRAVGPSLAGRNGRGSAELMASAWTVILQV